MPSAALRGIRMLHLCSVKSAQGASARQFLELRSVSRRVNATRNVPTHAAEQPLEVEVLPGPSSGTYRFRRTMSQRQVRKPFIIGVAGGTASGKTSVCEGTIGRLLITLHQY